MFPVSPSAFKPWHEQFVRDTVAKVARRYRLGESDIQDIAQLAVIRAREDIITRPPTGLSAIRDPERRLAVIAGNEVRRYTRRLRSTPRRDIDEYEWLHMPAPEEDASSDVFETDLGIAIQQILAMPAFGQFAEMARLRMEGRSMDEIGETFGLTISQARDYFSQQKLRLASFLEDRGLHPPGF